jgi:hypothetical protein
LESGFGGVAMSIRLPSSTLRHPTLW